VVKDQETYFDPYYRVVTETDVLPLEMFVPVAAVDFYNVFVTTWETKTVLVVPFENPRGTANWKPSPSEIYTSRMAAAIGGTGYFNTTMPSDGRIYTFDELTRSGMLKTIAQRNPSDIIFVSALQRTDLEDVTREKYLGLKKNTMVTASISMPTLILDAKTMEPIFNGPVDGSVDVPDKVEAEVGYRRLEQIKDDVFEEYSQKVANILLYHYHLVRHPMDKTLVRHMPSKDQHASQYH
jgi:outer membrane protein assembly factor BamB